MARAAAGGWFRLAGSTGDELVSASQSGFELSSYADLAADGVTTRGYTVTARNAAAAALQGKSASVATETITVSVANSYVTVSAATVAANTDVTVTVTLRDALDRPIPDIDVSRLTTTSSGTGNTFGSWTGRTDQQGRISRTFQSSVAEAKTITATAFGQTITDTAAVTVGGGGSGLTRLQWNTATGSTVNAVTDGGIADSPDNWGGCTWTNVLSVVDTQPGSWSRTANVLRVSSTPYCGHVVLADGFPAPATDTYWAARYYMLNGAGQTDAKLHPHCLWPVGAIEAVHTGIETRDIFDAPLSPADGRWSHTCGWGRTAPNHKWWAMDGSAPRVILADTWVRYEFIIHWLSSTTYRVYPRLYTLAGTLLNDASTYHSYGAGTDMSSYYGGGGYYTADSSSNVRNISWGMGGAGSGSGSYYVADVAIRTATGVSDFIGDA